MVLAGFAFISLATCAASMQQRAVKPSPLNLKLEGRSNYSSDLSAELLRSGIRAARPLSLAASSLETDLSCGPANWLTVESIPNISLKGKSTFCRNSKNQSKVLPQLYLLGSMKAGTTSIAQDLTNLGVRPADGQNKEFHFFGHTFDPLKQSVHKARAQWYTYLPKCPKDGSQMLLADYTPQMHYMQLDKGFRQLLPGPVANFSLPRTLERFYYKPKDKNRLVFVVSLREPLARMQSAWYAGKMCQNHCICTYCTHKTFRESLQKQLLEWHTVPRGVSDWLWASMYGHQLETWLLFFPAKSFVIQPLGLYSKSGISPLCKVIAAKTDFELNCDHLQEMRAKFAGNASNVHKTGTTSAFAWSVNSPTGRVAVHSAPASTSNKVTHEWTTEHPSLEKDADAQLLEDYRELFRADFQKLLNASLTVHAQGGALVGYGGEKGDRLAVAKWLEANW